MMAWLALLLLASAPAGARDGVVEGTITVRKDGKPVDCSKVIVHLDWPVDLKRRASLKKKALAGRAPVRHEIAQQDSATGANEFYPRVLPVMGGDSVCFPNKQFIPHNVYWRDPALVDLGKWTKGPGKCSEPYVATEPARAVHILCNVHDYMHAWVLVLESPYFAQPDGQCHYKIAAPAGSYDFACWQPVGKPSAGPLELKAGEAVKRDCVLDEGDLPPPSNKYLAPPHDVYR